MTKGPRDKQLTIDEVVAELKDGMTIGIGGWGPRRKPMALVRAILRSDLKDLTIVSWGGADVGLLARAGKIRKLVYAFVSLDSVPLEPNFQKARQEGTIPELVELDEGMFQTGLRAAAQRLPFLPMRAGLGSDVLVNQPWIKTVTSPYDDGDEELVAVPALHLDVALVHLNRADKHGNATYLGPDPYFDDLFCMAADRAYVSVEQVVDTAGLTVDTPVQRLLLSRMMVSGVVEAPNGAHFTTCTPDYERDEKFQRAYAAAASGTDEDWAAFSARFLEGDEASYQAAVAAFAEEAKLSDVTRADVCAAAIADAFKDDGEIFGSPMGLLPMLGVRLAKLTSNPDLVISDGESLFLAGVPPLFAKGDVVEGWIPFRKVFDVVAYGKRHVMMGATQVDRHGNQNISAIGDWAQPKRQLLGSRGAPGNTVNNRTSYWVPKHSARVFVERVDIVSGVGPKLAKEAGAGGRPLQRHPPDRQQPRRLRRQGRRRQRAAAQRPPGRHRRRGPRGDRLRARRPGRRTDDARAHDRGAGPDPRGARPEGPALQGGAA